MKQRMINTDLWTDKWVRSINPLDRLLFVYLLSNSHANISGVYELSDDVMAFEVGLNLKDIHDAFMPRLAPKVYYQDGWVILPKFPKHQNLQSSDVVKGVLREFEKAPENIRFLAIERGWGEGLGIVPPPSSTKPNLTKLISAEAPALVIEVPDRPTKTRKRVDEPILEVFRLFAPKYPKIWESNTSERKAAEILRESKTLAQIQDALQFYGENRGTQFCPDVSSPWKLANKWGDLITFKEKNNL